MFTIIWSFLGCAIFALIWSFFSRTEEPLPSPPSVTITGVRIPADGTPAHLLSLTTTTASGATDCFLFHVPNLRQYWNTEQAWRCRNLHRLDLQQQHYLQQRDHLEQQNRLRQRLDLLQLQHRQPRIHLPQRFNLPQQLHLLQQNYLSCIGTYYVFYSSDLDDLPKNSSVPAWIRGGGFYGYCGDVFLVKMAPHEFGQYGWAAYEDIVPEFLDLLAKGPFCGQRRSVERTRVFD